jgi:hypothetical protein
MKRQYVVTLRNTNQKLSQTLRYLASVNHGYANKSTEIKDAMVFSTKAEARQEICKIGKNNLYHTDVNIILL